MKTLILFSILWAAGSLAMAAETERWYRTHDGGWKVFDRKPMEAPPIIRLEVTKTKEQLRMERYARRQAQRQLRLTAIQNRYRPVYYRHFQPRPMREKKTQTVTRFK